MSSRRQESPSHRSSESRQQPSHSRHERDKTSIVGLKSENSVPIYHVQYNEKDQRLMDEYDKITLKRKKKLHLKAVKIRDNYRIFSHANNMNVVHSVKTEKIGDEILEDAPSRRDTRPKSVIKLLGDPRKSSMSSISFSTKSRDRKLSALSSSSAASSSQRPVLSRARKKQLVRKVRSKKVETSSQSIIRSGEDNDNVSEAIPHQALSKLSDLSASLDLKRLFSLNFIGLDDVQVDREFRKQLRTWAHDDARKHGRPIDRTLLQPFDENEAEHNDSTGDDDDSTAEKNQKKKKQPQPATRNSKKSSMSTHRVVAPFTPSRRRLDQIQLELGSPMQEERYQRFLSLALSNSHESQVFEEGYGESIESERSSITSEIPMQNTSTPSEEQDNGNEEITVDLGLLLDNSISGDHTNNDQQFSNASSHGEVSKDRDGAGGKNQQQQRYSIILNSPNGSTVTPSFPEDHFALLSASTTTTKATKTNLDKSIHLSSAVEDDADDLEHSGSQVGVDKSSAHAHVNEHDSTSNNDGFINSINFGNNATDENIEESSRARSNVNQENNVDNNQDHQNGDKKLPMMEAVFLADGVKVRWKDQEKINKMKRQQSLKQRAKRERALCKMYEARYRTSNNSQKYTLDDTFSNLPDDDDDQESENEDIVARYGHHGPYVDTTVRERLAFKKQKEKEDEATRYQQEFEERFGRRTRRKRKGGKQTSSISSRSHHHEDESKLQAEHSGNDEDIVGSLPQHQESHKNLHRRRKTLHLTNPNAMNYKELPNESFDTLHSQVHDEHEDIYNANNSISVGPSLTRSQNQRGNDEWDRDTFDRFAGLAASHTSIDVNYSSAPNPYSRKRKHKNQQNVDKASIPFDNGHAQKARASTELNVTPDEGLIVGHRTDDGLFWLNDSDITIHQTPTLPGFGFGQQYLEGGTTADYMKGDNHFLKRSISELRQALSPNLVNFQELWQQELNEEIRIKKLLELESKEEKKRDADRRYQEDLIKIEMSSIIQKAEQGVEKDDIEHEDKPLQDRKSRRSSMHIDPDDLLMRDAYGSLIHLHGHVVTRQDVIDEMALMAESVEGVSSGGLSRHVTPAVSVTNHSIRKIKGNNRTQTEKLIDQYNKRAVVATRRRYFKEVTRQKDMTKRMVQKKRKHDKRMKQQRTYIKHRMKMYDLHLRHQQKLFKQKQDARQRKHRQEVKEFMEKNKHLLSLTPKEMIARTVKRIVDKNDRQAKEQENQAKRLLELRNLSRTGSRANLSSSGSIASALASRRSRRSGQVLSAIDSRPSTKGSGSSGNRPSSSQSSSSWNSRLTSRFLDPLRETPTEEPDSDSNVEYLLRTRGLRQSKRHQE